MASRLLSHDREDRGLPGQINRQFERLKHGYGRIIDATLAARPAVYTIWGGLTLVMIPMFMMAWKGKELAPAEDEGVVFGILQAPANATIEQTAFYANDVNKLFEAVPETAQTFQLTFPGSGGTGIPGSGFSGMVLKPWSERTRTAQTIQPEIQQEVGSVPGVNLFMSTPPSPPGGGQFPVEFVLSATAEPTEILPFAQRLVEIAAMSGKFAYPPDVDTKIDQPEVELHDRSRQGCRARLEPGRRLVPTSRRSSAGIM